jgi:hypothetical protein
MADEIGDRLPVLMENRSVMRRRVLTFGLVIAVHAGAVYSPFLHAHVDEDHDEHHSTPVHAHFAGHTPKHNSQDAASIDEREHDRAIYLQAFVAVEAAAFEIPLAAATTFTLTVPAERAPRVSVLVTHGHDPPFASALDSRPPPRIPVLI